MRFIPTQKAPHLSEMGASRRIRKCKERLSLPLCLDQYLAAIVEIALCIVVSAVAQVFLSGNGAGSHVRSSDLEVGAPLVLSLL